ncbi:HEPN domain-containing protein [Chitinophaga sp. LS1]|uniref:HEPN domain-containing protein n=1 Tax=Chitinophaga sp. LS1 TaxID=3051176 RepID=UPI002AABD522|nr:HEPN domain-containing protein [Chitinophaga sp. LS1]WPV65420.1 HEPN domain-containing protein [Chitinophaga sp. LS1]
MRNNLPHLSKLQITQLAKLIEKILRAMQPELILCLGSRTTTMQDWSCFWEEEGYRQTVFPTTYDLLILTGEDEKRADHELIQLIEQQAGPLACEVTCMIQPSHTFYEGLEKGYRFDTTVYRKAVGVYSNGRQLLPVLPAEPEPQALKGKIEDHWNRCFTIAQRFFKAATDCQQDNWPEQAAFNLHQSTQHACMALLRVFTGYRSTTHNLSRLLALIENFSFELSIIFPCLTKEEKELFNLLNRAYSDARYKEHYTISAEKVTILTERVQELLMVAEMLYKNRQEQLAATQALVFPIKPSHEKQA